MNNDFNKIKCFLITKDKTQLEVKKLCKKLSDFDLTFLSPQGDDWLTLKSTLATCPKSKYCFIIKDDSISYAKGDTISKFITSTLKSSWDVFYLCKWLDNCEKYNNYTKTDTNYLTTRVYSPHGLQALILSPEGRDKLEKLKIESGEQLITFIPTERVMAYGSVPNLFNIDPIRYADDLDVVKTFACSSVYPSRPVDLTEPAIVNNLQTQLVQNTLPQGPEPAVQEKRFYDKFTNVNTTNIFIWLTILIMFIVLIDSCILCYRHYKGKDKKED